MDVPILFSGTYLVARRQLKDMDVPILSFETYLVARFQLKDMDVPILFFSQFFSFFPINQVVASC